MSNSFDIETKTMTAFSLNRQPSVFKFYVMNYSRTKFVSAVNMIMIENDITNSTERVTDFIDYSQTVSNARSGALSWRVRQAKVIVTKSKNEIKILMVKRFYCN